MYSKPELLAPAGDAAGLRAALDAGADAVYFGAGALNMRQRAKNFTLENIGTVANTCHDTGAKCHLTLNTIVYQKELPSLNEVLDAAAEAEVDAVICWDMAVIEEALKRGINIHLSTQASVSNARSILRYYKNTGICRFVLARECSLEDVADIQNSLREELGEEASNIELEAFIHGAMCVAVSGRCFMSEYSFGNSANRGKCLQPCRRKYRIIDVEEKYEYELGSDYVMSPKDLCTMPFLEKILDAGFASFKIEGRMRNPEYAATVVGAYRKAIDFYWDNFSCITEPYENQSEKKDGAGGSKVNYAYGSPEAKEEFQLMKKELTEKLRTVFNRDFSSGFYMGKPVNEWTKSPGSLATRRKETVGIVINYYQKISVAEIKVQGASFSVGDELIIQGPTTGSMSLSVESIQVDHKQVALAESGTHVAVKVPGRVRLNDAVYLRKPVQ